MRTVKLVALPGDTVHCIRECSDINERCEKCNSVVSRKYEPYLDVSCVVSHVEIEEDGSVVYHIKHYFLGADHDCFAAQEHDVFTNLRKARKELNERKKALKKDFGVPYRVRKNALY